MRKWINSGEPWVWMTAGAVALSLVAVYAVVWMTAAQGLGHWWPKPLIETTVKAPDGSTQRMVGEVRDSEEISLHRLRESGYQIESDDKFTRRYLFKVSKCPKRRSGRPTIFYSFSLRWCCSPSRSSLTPWPSWCASVCARNTALSEVSSHAQMDQ